MKIIGYILLFCVAMYCIFFCIPSAIVIFSYAGKSHFYYSILIALPFLIHLLALIWFSIFLIKYK
ncbi:MAG: hypothetical protein EAZ53_06815 [Bacteroidetes bacterium]|nr:MAG: hypothetical protein EAZ53_06815 [Bacteroidota bacterium]